MKNNEEKKFYNVGNKYLADGLAFLGFRYMKMGFGKDTMYTFEDTEKFRENLDVILKLKRAM